MESFEESLLEVLRTLPHRHVAAALGPLIKTGLDQISSSEKSRELSLILGLIVARVIDPQSKLATSGSKRRLKGKENIGLRVGKVTGRFKMA